MKRNIPLFDSYTSMGEVPRGRVIPKPHIARNVIIGTSVVVGLTSAGLSYLGNRSSSERNLHSQYETLADSLVSCMAPEGSDGRLTAEQLNGLYMRAGLHDVAIQEPKHTTDARDRTFRVDLKTGLAYNNSGFQRAPPLTQSQLEYALQYSSNWCHNPNAGFVPLDLDDLNQRPIPGRRK